MIFHYLVLAVVKIIDNIITTEKTILTQKNKALAASVLVVVAQIMFYFLITEIVADNNTLAILVVSIASGIGSYIAFYINNKFSKDKVYINIITANDISQMKDFGDHMRAEGIKIVTFNAYNDDVKQTLTALVFADTKCKSSKIDNYISQHDGFYRQIVI